MHTWPASRRAALLYGGAQNQSLERTTDTNPIRSPGAIREVLARPDAIEKILARAHPAPTASVAPDHTTEAPPPDATKRIRWKAGDVDDLRTYVVEDPPPRHWVEDVGLSDERGDWPSACADAEERRRLIKTLVHRTRLDQNYLAMTVDLMCDARRSQLTAPTPDRPSKRERDADPEGASSSVEEWLRSVLFAPSDDEDDPTDAHPSAASTPPSSGVASAQPNRPASVATQWRQQAVRRRRVARSLQPLL